MISNRKIIATLLHYFPLSDLEEPGAKESIEKYLERRGNPESSAECFFLGLLMKIGAHGRTKQDIRDVLMGLMATLNEIRVMLTRAEPTFPHNFSNRELATVLAALRFWQDHGPKQENGFYDQLETQEQDYLDNIRTNGGEYEDLSTKEIDQLCLELNFGE